LATEHHCTVHTIHSHKHDSDNLLRTSCTTDTIVEDTSR